MMSNTVTVFANGTIISPVRQVKADLVIEGTQIKEIRESSKIMPGSNAFDA